MTSSAAQVTPQVGIITGAASGIGRASALELAATGRHLVLCDLSEQETADVASGVQDRGGAASVVVADVRDPSQMATVTATALERWGRIDLLVHCAGAVDQSTVVGGDPDRWADVVTTNVLGTMVAVRAVLPSMLEQRRGHLCLMASVSGRRAYVGEPAYIASKWGVVGFGNALRLEVESSNIRVTLVEPGLVDTPFTRGNPAVEEMKRALTPLQPTDVARAIAFAVQQPAHVGLDEIVIRPVGEGAHAG